jgi:hypothetical protein
MANKNIKKKRTKKRVVQNDAFDPVQKDTNLPNNHRYDEEIANKTSALLIKAQFQRIDESTSIEKFLKSEIKEVIIQRTMSRVANMYFEGILDLSRKTPFTPVVTKLFEAIYSEYVITSHHLSKFKDISMRDRVNNILDSAKNKSWDVKIDFSINEKIISDNSMCIRLYESWKSRFNDDGSLSDTISMVVKTDSIGNLVEEFYQNGIQLYRDQKRNNIFHILIFPDNNIPGIPLSPPSVKV